MGAGGTRGERSAAEAARSEAEGLTKPGGVLFEVAPDPNDAELTAAWDSLSEDAKAQLSSSVASDMVPKVLSALGATGSVKEQVGGYLGATNPSLVLKVDSPEQSLPVAKLLGYVLSQDSMVSLSETEVAEHDRVGVVTLALPENYGEPEIAALYDRLWELEHKGEKLVGGHTTAGGKMAILNFSELTTEELAKTIDDHLGGEFSVDGDEIYAAFPQKEEYGYGSDNEKGTATGRSPVQERGGNLRAEASEAIRAGIERYRSGSYAQPGRGAGAAAPTVRYGNPTDGSVSATGVHYSKEQRAELDSAKYGTGSRALGRHLRGIPAKGGIWLWR